MEAIVQENYYISFASNPVRFESINIEANVEVFFDDSNVQVFVVRASGAAVVVKSSDEKRCGSFRLSDRGRLRSIKFSPDLKILAILRVEKSVEFINFIEWNPQDQTEYSQACKGKSTKILGYYWISPAEIVFVADYGVEHYQVIADKKSLKLMKSYSVNINWVVNLPKCSALILSTGSMGNVLQPFIFAPGSMVKLQKFEINISASQKRLQQRDVTLITVYDKVYVSVKRQQIQSVSTSPSMNNSDEIFLYPLQHEGASKCTDILLLELTGNFALNVLDNLIIIHHQSSKTSMAFDIGLGGENDGSVTRHHPILPPLPICPFKIRLPTIPGLTANEEINCELYSMNWTVFNPNIVIDAQLGYMWQLVLRLEPILSMGMHTKVQMVEFLLLRSDSKTSLLSICRQMVSPSKKSDMVTIARIFDRLNYVYLQYLEYEIDNITNFNGVNMRTKPKVIIDQKDMYTQVVSPLAEHKDVNKFIIAVLIEYIRSLSQLCIPVEFFLYEMLINILVRQKQFYQLHQFLQYHVVSDSKQLACLLLSLQNEYPPTHQLALDMLKRLGTANDEIVEVLLSNQQVLAALRFVRSIGQIDQISARKFLEAAQNCDLKTFFSVYQFFEQRNLALRSNAKFAPGEHCEKYVEYFKLHFNNKMNGLS